MTLSQIRESDRDKSVTASLGRARVQCVVEGGRPEPQVSLFSGGRNITEEGAGGSFCRAAGRDTVCVQFDLDITANMSGGSLR